MDSGFVFTVFIDFRPCPCVCVAVGALGDEFLLDVLARKREGERVFCFHGRVWHGEKCKLFRDPN